MTEGSPTELGVQRWLPVQEVTGRPEARPRRRCCSEFSHVGHVGRSLVDVNEMHLEAYFVDKSRFVSAVNVKHIRTGVMWSLGLVSVMRRAAAFCTRCKGLMDDSGRPASTALQ